MDAIVPEANHDVSATSREIVKVDSSHLRSLARAASGRSGRYCPPGFPWPGLFDSDYQHIAGQRARSIRTLRYIKARLAHHFATKRGRTLARKHVNSFPILPNAARSKYMYFIRPGYRHFLTSVLTL